MITWQPYWKQDCDSAANNRLALSITHKLYNFSSQFEYSISPFEDPQSCTRDIHAWVDCDF